MSRTDSLPGVSRLGVFRDRVRRLPGGALAWRIGVTVIGLLVIVGGIILLPLPGPGWLIIFFGIGIWATEYAWAARLLTWARATVSRWLAWAGQRPRWLQVILGLLAVVFLVAIAFAAWYVL
jgi:uncharacterized protein (TIGR02611 family)